MASEWNSRRFHKALRKLQRDFPECYIEAWTPADFADPGQGQPWSVTMEDALEVACELDKHFDANHGTNWSRVCDTIEGVAKHLDLQGV